MLTTQNPDILPKTGFDDPWKNPFPFQLPRSFLRLYTKITFIMSEQENRPYERMTDEAFNAFDESSFESNSSKNWERGPGSEAERNWSTIAHLSGLAGYIIPFGMILGPLLVWLMKRDEMPVVGEHARRALNFQITVLIGIMISIPLMFIFIGVPMLILVGLGQLIFTIIAGVKANEGQDYEYPYSLDLVK